MPAVGVLVGGPLATLLGVAADYVAIAILIGFGAYTLVGKEQEDEAGASRLATAQRHGADPDRAEHEPR
jgi:putative Mn2+ efflux pump MntP